MPDGFEEHPVPVYAATLEARLPATLVIAKARQRKVYGVIDTEQIERVLKSYRDFVALCARKESETGEPCLTRAKSRLILIRKSGAGALFAIGSKAPII